MKRMHWAVAAAALLSAGAFAQTAVQSTTVTSTSGIPVTSGTGVVVTPGAPAVGVAAIPGAVIASNGTTTVAGAPGTTTTITRYWVNVPANVQSDPTFRRWQNLK
jgi:hypothetical protein